MTMTDIRQRTIEVAERCEGLTGPDMADLCGLGPDYAMALKEPFHVSVREGKYVTKGISTCGLVAEGILRLAGIAVPESWVPYHPLTAGEYSISRAIGFAIKNAAMVPTSQISPGDYVVIGSGINTHALIVIAVSEGLTSGGIVIRYIESIDGGRVADNGLQTVERVKREYQHGAMLNGRKIQSVIDVSRLPLQ